jgi:hypothetical protein
LLPDERVIGSERVGVECGNNYLSAYDFIIFIDSKIT